MTRQSRAALTTRLLTLVGVVAVVVAFAGLCSASTGMCSSGILVVIVCGFWIAARPLPSGTTEASSTAPPDPVREPAPLDHSVRARIDPPPGRSDRPGAPH